MGLTALVACALLLAPQTLSARISNLVAYYSLGEASGDALDDHASKTATDRNTVTADAGGIKAGARDFEQTNTEYFDRTDSAFSFTSDFSVSAWVKPESLAGNAGGYGAGIASYMSGDAAGDWWISADTSGEVVFAYFTTSGANATGLRYTGTGKLAITRWDHIVVRKSSSTFTIWVNGVSESFTSISTASGWSNLGFSIGRQYTSGTYHFDGLIDELSVFNAAISDADITYLYNSGAGRNYTETSGGAVVPCRGMLLGAGCNEVSSLRRWFLHAS